MTNWFIPQDIVLRSIRQDRHSDFVTFLLSNLDPVVVEDLVRDYQLGVTVSPVLQRNATREEREAHIDIADWLLRERCHPESVEGSRHCRAFLEIQKYISPEVAGEVKALIEELGLDVWRVEKVSEGISDEVPP